MVTPAYTQMAQPEQKFPQSQWERGIQGISGLETWHVEGRKSRFFGSKNGMFHPETRHVHFCNYNEFFEKNEKGTTTDFWVCRVSVVFFPACSRRARVRVGTRREANLSVLG